MISNDRAGSTRAARTAITLRGSFPRRPLLLARPAKDEDEWPSTATASEDLAIGHNPAASAEIDLEPIALALVTAGHFRAGVTEMPLHVGLFDLGRRRPSRRAANGRRTRACVRPRTYRREACGRGRFSRRAGRRACRSASPRKPRHSCGRSRRNRGPWLMRPSRIQVSSRTTGQVSGRDRDRSRPRASRSCR